jgi:hypothetical protein
MELVQENVNKPLRWQLPPIFKSKYADNPWFVNLDNPNQSPFHAPQNAIAFPSIMAIGP